MSTAPATPIRGRREMLEVKAPEQFKFTKKGETVSGVLISIDTVSINGKPTMEYMFLKEDGDRFTCLGVNDLNKKLHPGHIGHELQIRYEADDTSFQKPGQSPMKLFKVLVSKEKVITAPGE